MASTRTQRFTLFPTPAPQLPPFRTLLIQGDYPTSALFHLCLSSSCAHDGPKSRSVLVTARSKTWITNELVDLNDDWLSTNAGRGSTAEWLSRIQIFYPGTPDHWAFLFSLLRTDVPTEPGSMSLSLGRQPVSLVVLHEPSAYFLDNDQSKSCAWTCFTLGAYLRLITCALGSLHAMSTGMGPPPLAVFDSRLHELTLPILSVTINDPDIKETEFGPGRRFTKVISAVERYFELIGRVEIVPSQVDVNNAMSKRCRMILLSSVSSNGSLTPPIVWRWRQVRIQGADRSLRTTFYWSEI